MGLCPWDSSCARNRAYCPKTVDEAGANYTLHASERQTKSGGSSYLISVVIYFLCNFHVAHCSSEKRSVGQQQVYEVTERNAGAWQGGK